ncbi:MAG: FAD-dependent oxidoreductase, partial [Bacteroidales bacterium]
MKQYTLKRNIRLNENYDIIIIGGGPAGCAAAIAAARDGAKTLLVEATGVLGGMGTAGMVPAWCYFSDGEKIIYRGIAEKVFKAAKTGVLHEPVNALNWVDINPECLKLVYDRLVTESGADILFFTRLSGVEMRTKKEIDTLILSSKEGIEAYRAKVYIDCTGDGDLAAWAGAEYKIGDENQIMQSATHCFSLAGVDTYHYVNGVRIHGDNPQSPIYQILTDPKYPLIEDNHICQNLVGPGIVQFNAGHIAGTNTMNAVDLSRNMIKGREMANQYNEALKKYYPQAFGRSFVNNTAQLLGVREGRRIIGDYILTLDDFKARRQFPDEIGRNSYYVDIHIQGSESVHYKKGESHGIPYRILTPRGLDNLLVAGRCVSSDHLVYGSIRVMTCCLVMG